MVRPARHERTSLDNRKARPPWLLVCVGWGMTAGQRNVKGNRQSRCYPRISVPDWPGCNLRLWGVAALVPAVD